MGGVFSPQWHGYKYGITAVSWGVERRGPPIGSINTTFMLSSHKFALVP